jgi:hypothetical protein
MDELVERDGLHYKKLIDIPSTGFREGFTKHFSILIG